MRTNSVYKYLAGGLMILVLTCSIFANVVSAEEGSSETAPPPVTPAAQNIAPEEGTNETAPPTAPADPNADTNSFEQTSNINQAANPNAATDALEQSSGNTSANTQSQNNTDPKQAGGSGNKETEWSLKMLSPYYWIPAGMRIIGNTILMMFGWVLGLVGLVFNFIIDKTIVNLKTTVDSLGVITDIWKVIRDFINLFFIFALLYAAVGTILGLEKVDWKKTVGNLVLAALLINFSLFITKAALDLSNIVTIGFYSQLPGVGAVGSGAINPVINQSQAGGISNSIMQSLKLETIYKPKYNGTGWSGAAGDAASSPATAFAYILSTVMGSIFICVTIVVMVAACWLFLKRFIDVIFLMIRSPIAFAGLVLPQLQEYQSNWWKELQANAVFPPVYMAMMWITFKILQSPGFQTVAPGVDGFSGLFSTLSATTVNIVFRFIVVIAMMVYALKSAGKVGVEGGEIFNDFLKKKRGQLAGAVGGAIGRNTVGRGAAMLQDKNSAAGQALRKLESVPIIGAATSKAITGGLKNVSSATFGGAKGGFDQMVKDEAKYAKEGYARVGEKREWREEFAMKEPVNPEPVKADGESEAAFTLRRSKYDDSDEKEVLEKAYEENKKKYESAKVNYTARKKTFDADQKKNAEDRQKQFKTNYEKADTAKIPLVRYAGIGANRPASVPFLGENRAALKVIDEKIEADKKKENKEKEDTVAWEKGILSFVRNIGTEMTAALDTTRSRFSSEPADPANAEAVALQAAQRKIATEFNAEVAAIEALTEKKDEKEKMEKLGELRKKYKEVIDKMEDNEIDTLAKIEGEMDGASRQTKDELRAQKLRINKSQRARNELNRNLDKIAEKMEKKEEKERDKKEREEKERKDGGGGGGEDKGGKK